MSVHLLKSIEPSEQGFVGLTNNGERIILGNVTPRVIHGGLDYYFKKEDIINAIDYNENGLNRHIQESFVLLGNTEFIMSGGQYQLKLIPYISSRRKQ